MPCSEHSLTSIVLTPWSADWCVSASFGSSRAQNLCCALMNHYRVWFCVPSVAVKLSHKNFSLFFTVLRAAPYRAGFPVCSAASHNLLLVPLFAFCCACALIIPLSFRFMYAFTIVPLPPSTTLAQLFVFHSQVVALLLPAFVFYFVCTVHSCSTLNLAHSFHLSCLTVTVLCSLHYSSVQFSSVQYRTEYMNLTHCAK